MRWLACLLSGAMLWAAEPARMIYSKSFPGSTPAFVLITVDQTGKVEYKEAVDDDRPDRFEVPAAEAATVFQLIEKLGRFDKPLESGLKVANMGMKTFRFEDGTVKNEQKFNYSLDENARLLQDWFEKVVETEGLYFNLERAVKFDKLGVHKAILQTEAGLDRKRLMAPERFLPLLDRVVKNDSYLHMARERAAGLAQFIRDGKVKAE